MSNYEFQKLNMPVLEWNVNKYFALNFPFYVSKVKFASFC